jgi:ADP-heptose:LPS heptosyltransferase
MLMAAPERWDEVCFAVPAVRALISGGLTIGILCPENQSEFWKTIQSVKVISFSPKAKSKQLTSEIRGNWDASLAWEYGVAAETFKLAGISRRLGPPDCRLAKFLTHPLHAEAGPLEHRVRHYLTAVESLGMETEKSEFFAPMAADFVPNADTVLLCPDSDFGITHEWRVDRWREVSEKLIAAGYHLTIACVNGERRLAEKLAVELGENAKTFHATPLGTVLPQLASYQWVIGADASLPHLAAHAGGTCIVLFGPNDPSWRRPLGKRHTTIRRHVECAPCLLARCAMDMRCQNELDVERVWAFISEQLNRPR